MKNKVPVQKGSIVPSEKTMKTMSHAEKVSERKKELAMLRDGGTLKMDTPKGRK